MNYVYQLIIHQQNYRLITSNHTIPIKGMIFLDWEDNNGSKAKRLNFNRYYPELIYTNG